MKYKDFWKQFFAGLFFIACMAAVVVVVFVIGIEKGLTEPKFEMTVVFHKVGGLNIGAPVRVSGVTVGTVSDIYFLEEEIDNRGVGVTMNLLQKYRDQVFKTVRVAIITEGVLGEKVIEITTSGQQQLASLNEPVIGEDPLDVQSLAETFGDAATVLLEAAQTIDTISDEVQNISGSTIRLLNRIEQRIIDGSLFKVF